jgi:putative glutamine amidotransferase
MKPLIGIGADIGPDVIHSSSREQTFGYMTYVKSLERAGAIPVLIPPQAENVDELLESLDGVLLAGGEDCDPAVYGEERHPTVEPMDHRRQSSDLTLAARAYERGVPLLGICLGMQVINVVAGGTLVQDIQSEHPDAMDHASEPSERSRHEVDVDPGSRLATIIGAGRKEVNSSHHQAVRTPGSRLKVTAKAPDGIVEALEDPQHPFCLGVQWHPEDMQGEESATTLFAAFVEAARTYAERKKRVLV